MMRRVEGVFLGVLVILCATAAFAVADTEFFSEMSPIPEEIRRQMIGTTWEEGCPVSLDQLAYLKLSHWGFDDQVHVGELIVNKAIAENTVEVFRALFALGFPIESMKLPSHYFGHPDDPSKANNSSGFFHRKDTQSTKQLSIHSYGLAFDLNPFYNPAILPDGKTDPEGAGQFLNRRETHKGMIREGDEAFLVMTRLGWAWGGFFKHGADPMHFEKIINRNYIINSLEYFPNDWGVDGAL